MVQAYIDDAKRSRIDAKQLCVFIPSLAIGLKRLTDAQREHEERMKSMLDSQRGYDEEPEDEDAPNTTGQPSKDSMSVTAASTEQPPVVADESKPSKDGTHVNHRERRRRNRRAKPKRVWKKKEEGQKE